MNDISTMTKQLKSPKIQFSVKNDRKGKHDRYKTIFTVRWILWKVNKHRIFYKPNVENEHDARERISCNTTSIVFGFGSGTPQYHTQNTGRYKTAGEQSWIVSNIRISNDFCRKIMTDMHINIQEVAQQNWKYKAHVINEDDFPRCTACVNIVR